MTKTEVETYLESLKTPAILPFRPYPPIDLPQTNSWLGGLPFLDDNTEWPRASDGVPLHFLARIDCAELPEERGDLPNEGVLQFFARIDEEMVWEGDSAEFARVLFHKKSTGGPTPPPDDLPPLEGGWHAFDREMRLPDEPFRRVYPKWPLEFHTIWTWPSEDPDLSSSIERSDYIDAIQSALLSEIRKHTPDPLDWGLFLRWRWNPQANAHAETHNFPDVSFPHAWLFIEFIGRSAHRLAETKAQDLKWQIANDLRPGRGSALPGRRSLLTRLSEWFSRRPQSNPNANHPLGRKAPAEERLHDAEILSSEALDWVGRAAEAERLDPLAVEVCEEFRAWIGSYEQRAKDGRNTTLTLLVRKAVARGISEAVKFCGDSEEASRMTPSRYMEWVEPEHSLLRTEVNAGDTAPTVSIRLGGHHQMLGFAQDSQGFGPPSDSHVLLLQLASDKGVDFMFCDLGEIQFWIDEGDLAARRFDRIIANTQGG